MNKQLRNECIEYMKLMHEEDWVNSIGEMLKETSYVYLTRPARIRLVLEILLTLFRG